LLVRVQLDDNADAIVRTPTLVGALLGKASAVTEIVTLTSAEKAKHLLDVDALARLLGPSDRAGAGLTAKEASMLSRLAERTEMSALASRSIDLLVSSISKNDCRS
jgi:hypothetical protein